MCYFLLINKSILYVIFMYIHKKKPYPFFNYKATYLPEFLKIFIVTIENWLHKY